MFTRFTYIVNGLKGLGRQISEAEKVDKTIRSPPSKWDFKTNAIEKAKNLKKLHLEELVGSLMTYEIKLVKQETRETR